MSLASNWISRVVGVTVEFVNFNLGQALLLSQRVAVVGQGNTASTYAEDAWLATSAAAAGEKYGYGSPIHLALRQLLPENGDGAGALEITVYPLEDDPSGVAAAGSIDCSGTATEDSTFKIKVGGISTGNITIYEDDTAATALGTIKTAINSVLYQPVIAGTVAAGSLPLTAKWKGESGNDIYIDISEIDIAGLTFSSVAFSGGAANPSVDDALLYIGNRWETMIVNCMNYDDTDTLDLYQTWGEGRWAADVKRPAIVFSGSVDDFSTRTAITDARKDDRINALIDGVASNELPFAIAARGVARIALSANNDPAMNYTQSLDGLVAGPDIDQETNNVKNNAVKLGASTSKKVGTKIVLHDTVTMYHPDAEGDYPAYRYVVDIVKLQNIVYNVDIVQEAMVGRPMLPDSDPQPVRSTSAIQPKNVLATLKNLATSLSSYAIISDLEYTKTNIEVEINGTNPKRLDTTFPTKVSGNVEVNDTTVKWGFYLPV